MATWAHEEKARWQTALKEGLLSGSLASVMSTVALALEGRRETGSAAAATNATSHWLWREEAFSRDELDLQHTLTGYLIHHGTSVFWATLYSRLYGQRPGAKSPPQVLPAALAASALACLVDYKFTPKRLTPGFEHRLSKPAMVTVFGSFALGLALGSLILGKAAKNKASRDDKGLAREAWSESGRRGARTGWGEWNGIERRRAGAVEQAADPSHALQAPELRSWSPTKPSRTGLAETAKEPRSADVSKSS